MAIALTKRRVVAVLPESPRGTVANPNATNDAIPTIGEPTFSPTPVSVERNLLRLSLTPYADIYPGVSTVEIKFIAELGGRENNPQTDYSVPNWADCMRACGFSEVSNANGSLKPRLFQNVTGLTGGTAGTPLRHGEAINGVFGTPTTTGIGVVVGDFFNEDDVLCIQETTAPVGSGTLTWTGQTSARATTGGTRSANSVVAFRLNSDVNTTECVTLDLYADGKRMRSKGCAGNFELQMDHGNTLRAAFTFTGVVSAYADVAMPATPFELHKVSPTFLGKEVRFYEIGSSPKFYGRDSAAGTPQVGSLNTIKLNTGNDVIARENSFDPSGVAFALVTGRKPSGSFNPDEVLVSEFDWVAKFIAGNAIRFKAMVGTAGTVTTQDGNTIDVIAPGIVMSGLGDGDRDGIMAWNGQFKCTGGNYSTTAGVELPGNDSEFTIIYR